MMAARRRKQYKRGIGRFLENLTEDHLAKASMDEDGRENKEYIREGMKYFDYGGYIGFGISFVIICVVAYYTLILAGILLAVWFFSGAVKMGSKTR